jgi:hypothetical protein
VFVRVKTVPSAFALPEIFNREVEKVEEGRKNNGFLLKNFFVANRRFDSAFAVKTVPCTPALPRARLYSH